MKVIYKYVLESKEIQEIEIPYNALILSCQFQNNELCIWANVDPEEKKGKLKILILGTGNPIPEEYLNGCYEFLATVQVGIFVWHVFKFYSII